MKRNMWNKIIAIGMAFGMLTASMPVLAFEDEMVVEDDSYIVVEDDTEAVITPEAADDVNIFDDSLVVEEDETEIGNQEIVPTNGFLSEEDENPSILTAAEDGKLEYNGMYYEVNDNEVSITGVVPDIHYKENGEVDFKDTCWITSVDIPETIDGLPVTEIGDSAFANCINLSAVSMRESIEMHGCGAFKDCPQLEEIRIEHNIATSNLMGARTAYAGAFYGCSSLKTISFGDAVTNIPTGLFYGCTGIEEIEIPSSVKTIEKGACHCKQIMNSCSAGLLGTTFWVGRNDHLILSHQ